MLGRMPTAPGIRTIAPLLLLSALGFAQQQLQTNSAASASSRETGFVSCHQNEQPKRVVSRVSASEDGKWHAYVEIDVRGDIGCLYTTRLWVAEPNAGYRVVYLIAPNRTAVANGMEILGWAKHSSMFLVRTEEWQVGSDAPDRQRVLAVDARTGMIYEPELEAIVQGPAQKQCSFRVTDAGFAAGRDVVILVRARLSTASDVDEREQDVPPAKRCANTQQTWSFNYGTGEVKQVANTERMQLIKKFLPKLGDN
jgi:hypothetical protein